MKQLFFLVAVALIISSQSFGQSNTPIFVGIQPNVTVEPFYEKGELDIDILPLVFEASLGLRTDLRISPIVNYHIGGQTDGISDLSVFTVLPIFFKKKEIRSDRPYGFYAGPVLGFGRNLINNHFTSTLAVEPGYMFEAEKRFTIALGLQAGGSYFSYDNQPDKWVSHWGPKVSLGYWIN